MPFGQHGGRPVAYRATSLDFINHPNPIEPYAGSQRHPLNGTPHLEKARLENTSNAGLFQLMLDTSSTAASQTTATRERPEKRQKTVDNALLDLPKPPVRNTAKRMRIPPTLSGLHQPPPNAGLLPSINTQKPQQSQTPQLDSPNAGPVPFSKQSAGGDSTALASAPKSHPEAEALQPPSKPSTRHKWTPEETRCLLQGVARFGIGAWTKILKCPDFCFVNRTPQMLKDRFRVCRPGDYRPHRSHPHRPDIPDQAAVAHNAYEAVAPAELAESSRDQDKADASGPISTSERVSSSDLRELGITQPFVRASRRPRRGYSAAEDEALMQGFKKYGNSWAAIQSDPSLGLSTRSNTDLRDRFRTRFPLQFAQAGLTPKHGKHAAAAHDDAGAAAAAEPLPELDHDFDPADPLKDTLPAASSSSSAPTTDLALLLDKPALVKAPADRRQQAPSLFFPPEDVFLGIDFGEDDDAAGFPDAEPIVLDRGILDWAAADGAKAVPSEPGRDGDVDPVMVAAAAGGGGAGADYNPRHAPRASYAASDPFMAMHLAAAGGATSLPSLGPLVAAGASGVEPSEPLGLPSLMHWFGAEGESRAGLAGSSFPTLDEILS